MSGLDELRESFFQECEDLLESLGDGLRQLSDAPEDGDLEVVHAVFRAVHSIKGGAGAFGLDKIVTFAHLFETVLDHMRCERMQPTPELMRTLLRAGDQLADLVASAQEGCEPDEAQMTQLLAELDALSDGIESADDGADETFEFVPTVLSVEPLVDLHPEETNEPEAGAVRRYRLSFTPRGDLYGTGNEPQAVFNALAQLGDLEVSADAAAVPMLMQLDLADPKIRWTLELETEAGEDEIQSVFEFVIDLADIAVEEAGDPGAIPVSGAEGEPEASGGTDGSDAVPPIPPTPSGSKTAKAPASDCGPGEPNASPVDATGIAAAHGMPSADGPPATPLRQTSPAQPTTQASTPQATIRVNLDRVDRLINLIGELVIMEAMLSQAVEGAGVSSNSDVATGLEGIKQLASGIQEGVMSIRAQPLKPVFQRMHRIVREASDATGKQVRLETVGDATEVDKTVVEKLIDPLTHMIRNSVDHGLEDEAGRLASDKPAIGTITLSAAHRSGRVLIEVSDDGAGIDREKVRLIAEAKGLVPPDTPMSPGEIDNLLFAPGFSSKEEVSALSGRGVGLDVVKREIQTLGGRVGIQSVPGEGTTFTIALPLTLAVLEGMLIEFGGEMMVLPLSSIVETQRLSSATIHPIGLGGRVLVNHGDLVPIIDLAEVFGVKKGRAGAGEVLLVVECEAGRRAALAVDAIHDQRQVVIKSLEDNYRAVPGISAATILGDGRIALIVDPEDVIAAAAPDSPTPFLAVNE